MTPPLDLAAAWRTAFAPPKRGRKSTKRFVAIRRAATPVPAPGLVAVHAVPPPSA